MARGPSISSTIQVPIATLDDMRLSLEWFRSLLPDTAREELALEHARGNLLDETTLIDGRKGTDVDKVKPFGKIQYVGGIGPIDAATIMADAVAHARAPVRTGHYARALQWFVNGQPVGGPPTAEQVGIKGNAELVDLAPYASMVEIQVPRGVIFAAYNAVARAFGSSLSIRFGYGKAKAMGGHAEKAGTKGGRYFSVPVLTIGNPVSTVIPGRTSPGVNIRERRSTARRALRRYLGAAR
jgi:hypothetical protein